MKKVVAKKTKINKKKVVKKPVKKSTKKIMRQTTVQKTAKKVIKNAHKKQVVKTKKPIKSTEVKTKVTSKKTVVKAKTKPKSKVKIATKTKAAIKSKVKEAIKVSKVSKITKPKVVAKVTTVKKAIHALKKAPVIKLKKGAGPVNVKPYQVKKNEEYMNEKQRSHFRSVLLKWKEQLMSEVDRTVHHMQDEVSNYPDPVDRASQEEEFNLELRARDRERKLLRKINEALNRINDNNYGYCDDCGAEIGISRLEVRPTATQCIECKTVAEIREKQIGDGNIFD